VGPGLDFAMAHHVTKEWTGEAARGSGGAALEGFLLATIMLIALGQA
jgi:hypothetical protein